MRKARASAPLITSLGLVLALVTERTRASEVLAGTMAGNGHPSAHVLRYAGGTSWIDISPATVVPIVAVWDLEAFDGSAWAGGEIESGQGFVARWYGTGSDWEIYYPPTPVTGLAVVGGSLYAITSDGVLLRHAGAALDYVGQGSPAWRLVGRGCEGGAGLLFSGESGERGFELFDPTGARACTSPCPASSPLCGAGCFGPGQITSLGLQDDGAGPRAFAGSSDGQLFRWNDAAGSFEPRIVVRANRRIDALVSFRGLLHVGTDAGDVHVTHDGSLGHNVLDWGPDPRFAISALAADDPASLLWIGFGNVPWDPTRDALVPGIWTWDGDFTVESRANLDGLDGGVPALLVAGDTEVASCVTLPIEGVPCGQPTAVQLVGWGANRDSCGILAADFSWTGDFIEGTATGRTPVVHFDRPGFHAVTLTVSTPTSSSSCSTHVEIRDVAAPTLSAPASIAVGCDETIPPAEVTVLDACDPAPVVTLSESTAPGRCPQEYSIRRTWTARDAAGNTASRSQDVLVIDDDAPALLGLPPASATAACDAVPAPASVSALDTCDPAPRVTLTEVRTDGPCRGSYQLARTWDAEDACGNIATFRQELQVEDTQPPMLLGVPPDAATPCDAVPAPESVTAMDACDPSPRIDVADRRIDGPCPHAYRLERTYAAIDDCGNAVSRTQIIDVSDAEAPELLGVPPDAIVACSAVPPPAPVTARDSCDPAPGVELAERRIDGPCPATYRLERTWAAIDACGNAISRMQRIDVADTTPPTVVASSELVTCLWPPNHRMVTVTLADLRIEAHDDCSAFAVRLTGCVSDEPDDDLGDGAFGTDCVVGSDGASVQVRAERQGTRPDGRRYALQVTATDECGNESLPTTVGIVHVPHDRRSRGCAP